MLLESDGIRTFRPATDRAPQPTGFEQAVTLAQHRTTPTQTPLPSSSPTAHPGSGSAGATPSPTTTPTPTPAPSPVPVTDTPPTAAPPSDQQIADAEQAIVEGAADHKAEPPPVTVDNPVTRQVKPVVEAAQDEAGEVQTQLDTHTGELEQLRASRERLLAEMDQRGVKPGQLDRLRQLDQQIATLAGQVEADEQALATAQATEAAGQVVLYGEQAAADEATAGRSGAAADQAYQNLVGQLPQGVTLTQGDELPAEQVARMPPDGQAAYNDYVRLQTIAANDRAKVNADLAALDHHYAQLAALSQVDGGPFAIRRGDTLTAIARQDGVTLAELLADNPQFDPAKLGGGIQRPGRDGRRDPDALSIGETINGVSAATQGIAAIDRALAPLRMEMTPVGRVDAATAATMLEEAGRGLDYHSAVWNGTTAAVNGLDATTRIRLAEQRVASLERTIAGYRGSGGSTLEGLQQQLTEARAELDRARRDGTPALIEIGFRSAYVRQLQAGDGVTVAQAAVTTAQSAYDGWARANPNLPAEDNPHGAALTRPQDDLSLARQRQELAASEFRTAYGQIFVQQRQSEVDAAYLAMNGGLNVCLLNPDPVLAARWRDAQTQLDAARIAADGFAVTSGQLGADLDVRLAEGAVGEAERALQALGSSAPPTAIDQAQTRLTAAREALFDARQQQENAQYLGRLHTFERGLPAHLRVPRTAEDQAEGEARRAEFMRETQFQYGLIDDEAAQEQVREDLAALRAQIDNRGALRSAVDWVNESFGGERSELEAYLESHLGELEALERRKGELTEQQYQAELDRILGGYGVDYLRMMRGEAENDRAWGIGNEIVRGVVATTVGIGVTIVTGGNFVAGAAAGFGTYALLDTADDVVVKARGGDIAADGHVSLLGLGLDAMTGDASWNDIKIAGVDLVMNGVSSTAVAGGMVKAGTISAQVGGRLVPGLAAQLPGSVATRLGVGGLQSAAPGIASRELAAIAYQNGRQSLAVRMISTSAGVTTFQAVGSASAMVNTTIRLGADGTLLTPEGGQALLHEGQNQSVYVAAAPFVGLAGGWIPAHRVVGQTALNAGSNFAIEGVRAQVVDGRPMNGMEALAAGLGTMPGTLTTIAANPTSRLGQWLNGRAAQETGRGVMADPSSPDWPLIQRAIDAGTDPLSGPIDPAMFTPAGREQRIRALESDLRQRGWPSGDLTRLRSFAERQIDQQDSLYLGRPDPIATPDVDTRAMRLAFDNWQRDGMRQGELMSRHLPEAEQAIRDYDARLVYDDATNRSYLRETDGAGNEYLRPLDTGDAPAIYDKHTGLTYVVDEAGQLEVFARGDNRRARPTYAANAPHLINVMVTDPATGATYPRAVEPLFVRDDRGGYRPVAPEEAIWHDPASDRTFTLDVQSGDLVFHARTGETPTAERPAAPSLADRASFPDRARIFNPVYNREYVFDAARSHFTPLDPGRAPIYYHEPSNSTFAQNPDGSYAFFGAGDYRHNPNSVTRLPGMGETRAPQGYEWHFDPVRNQTFTYDPASQTLLPLDAGNRLAHYDETANVTYLIDLREGRAVYFGHGDNRTARPGEIPGLVEWQNRLGDWRIGGAFRLGPSGVTLAASGVQLGSKTNYGRIAHDFRQSRGAGLRTASEELALSVRPQEYRNITARQYADDLLGTTILAGVLLPGLGMPPPIVVRSQQFALQMKGSTVMKIVDRLLFAPPAARPGTPPAYAVALHKVEHVGRAASGPYEVVELSVRLRAQPERVTLLPGQTDLLGTPADSRHGFAALSEPLPVTKVMKETKDSAILAGREARPEITFKDGLPAEMPLSSEFWGQVNAALGHVDIRVQLIALDPAAIQSLRSTPTIAKLAELLAAGQLDQASAFAFIPDGKAGLQSGMRLSAVIGKEAFLETTDLTGQTRSRWHPDQTNLDIIFNQPYEGILKWMPNPDVHLHRLKYAIARSDMIGRIPLLRRVQNMEVQPLQLPGKVRPYELWNEAHHGQAPTRHTVTAGPGLTIGKLQLRFSFKTDADNRAPLGWVHQAMTSRPAAWEVRVTPGGRQALKSLLDHFAAEGGPQVQALTRQFRREIMPGIHSGEYLDARQIRAIQDYFGHPEIQPLLAEHQGFVLGDPGHAVVDASGFAVPAWLHRRLQAAERHTGVVMPTGGQAAMKLWLDQLRAGATPDQQARIDAFARTTLPKMKEGEFWTPQVVKDLLDFRQAFRDDAGRAA
jgi:hypothetical protein